MPATSLLKHLQENFLETSIQPAMRRKAYFPLLQVIALPLESRSGKRKEALPLLQIIRLINMLIEKLLYLALDLLLIVFKEYLSDPLELISPGSSAALNLRSLKKITRLI